MPGPVPSGSPGLEGWAAPSPAAVTGDSTPSSIRPASISGPLNLPPNPTYLERALEMWRKVIKLKKERRHRLAMRCRNRQKRTKFRNWPFLNTAFAQDFCLILHTGHKGSNQKLWRLHMPSPSAPLGDRLCRHGSPKPAQRHGHMPQAPPAQRAPPRVLPTTTPLVPAWHACGRSKW